MKLTIEIEITPETPDTYRLYTITHENTIICKDLMQRAALGFLGNYLTDQNLVAQGSCWRDEDGNDWIVLSTDSLKIALILEYGIIDDDEENHIYLSQHELLNEFTAL